MGIEIEGLDPLARDVVIIGATIGAAVLVGVLCLLALHVLDAYKFNNEVEHLGNKGAGFWFYLLTPTGWQIRANHRRRNAALYRREARARRE